MGIFMLWCTWAHEYMAIFFKLTGITRRCVLTRAGGMAKLGQHVNEMMAVAVKHFQNF